MKVTLAIITYNQEKYVEQAVRGAMAQGYAPLEIVVSDDCSTDRTFDIIAAIVDKYDGPHQLVINRNEANLGLAGNVNRVMELASGDIVLLAGGDDISLPDRAARSAEILMAHEDASCVNFELTRFADTDVPPGPPPLAGATTQRRSRHHYLQQDYRHFGGASRAFRREVFETFGPINADCPTEDSVMLLRCFLLGDVLRSDEVQVLYRVHGENLYASAKKYHIDVESIHRQYVQDLSLAAEKKILTPSEVAHFISVLEERLKERRFTNDSHLASESLSYFFRKFAFSSSASPSQKLTTLRAALTNLRR